MSDTLILSDYREARRAFLNAATAAGLDSISRVHPTAEGRDGKPLFLDTVSIGWREAQTALLVLTGAGGADGAFGSALLTRLLKEKNIAVPEQGKVVLLHALNPFGFSWGRAVDEANIDVNHNFGDFAALPDNPAYDALAEPLVSAAAELFTRPGTAEALAHGQFRHPDGLAFGGTGPSWSHRMLLDIFREELRHARRVIVLQVGTGAGEPGLVRFTGTVGKMDTIWRIWPDAVPAHGPYGNPAGALARREGVAAATLHIGTMAHTAFWQFLAQNRDGDVSAAFLPGDENHRIGAFQASEAALSAALAAMVA